MSGKRLKAVFVIIWLILSISSFSQNRANYWIYRDFGLKFEGDSVSILTSLSVPRNRGTGVMCNNSGGLLLYSDGITVWNSKRNIMPDGDSICANSQYSRMQSLIVPNPGNDSLYYVFSLQAYDNSGPAGLYYSIVNMNLDEGLGDVVMKGEKLLYKPSKRITAAYHDNHHDIWLITHENLTDRYYSFLITGDGVTETPVISTVGTMISSTTTGQLKVSPDGSKIVCSYTHDGDGEGFDLFQFNASTGELFNPLTFTTTTRGINGSEFSPDGSKLYILQSGSIGEATLFQYDVSEYNYNTIEESRATILHPVYNILEEMQLAPNGKIYFTKGGGDTYGLKHLGAIHAPNRSGTDCDVEENSLYLDGIQNLNPNPNFIQNYFFSNDFIFDNSCLGDSIYFQIVSTDQVDSVLWKFGDGNQSNEYNPIYLYSAPGDYQVQLISFYPNFIDTVKKNVQVYELPVVDLGNDSIVCEGFMFDFSTSSYDYLWSDGSSNNFFIPEESGTYWVEARNESGCTFSDTVHLDLKPTPYFSLGNDTVICDHISYILRPDNIYLQSTFLWCNNSTDTMISIDSSGLYWLQTRMLDGCTFSDSIYISVLEAPDVLLGNDTIINDTSIIQLDAGYFGSTTSYLWDNMSIERYRYVDGASLESGDYQFHVQVTAPNGCTDYDTISIQKLTFGINDHTENPLLLKIFPNPCRDFLVINNQSSFVTDIIIYNSLGEIVLSRKILPGETRINVSGLRSGMYVIKAMGNSKIYCKIKFIKESMDNHFTGK